MIFQTEDWTLGNSHARCSDQPIIFQKKNMETSQQNSQKPQTTSTSLQQFPTRKPPIKTPWFVFDASWTQESQHLENASHDMLQVTASSPLEVRCLTLVEWSSLNPSSLFNHLANWNNVSPTFGFPWNSPGFPFPFQKATFLGWGTSIFNSTAGFFSWRFFPPESSPFDGLLPFLNPPNLPWQKKWGSRPKTLKVAMTLSEQNPEILKLTKWQIAGQPNDPTIHLKNLPKGKKSWILDLTQPCNFFSFEQFLNSMFCFWNF